MATHIANAVTFTFMKTLFFYFMFATLTVSAQENYNQDQDYHFNLAEINLKNGNGLLALKHFHAVKMFEMNTIRENLAQIKIDSLLPIYQKLERQKWIGKWKLKQLQSNLFEYELITITNDSIIFYSKNDLNIPTRAEWIYPVKNTTANELPISKVNFANGEVWEFSVEIKDGQRRLFPTLKQSSDGLTWFLVDDRGIIRDPVARKKALESEIRTYYVPDE
jgi:hypothetical protein